MYIQEKVFIFYFCLRDFLENVYHAGNKNFYDKVMAQEINLLGAKEGMISKRGYISRSSRCKRL